MNAIDPSMAPPVAASQLTPAHVVRAFRKHWLIGAIVAVAVVAAAVFFTIGQKRIYRSSAVLLIDPKPTQPLGRDAPSVVDLGAGSYLSNKEYYQTQYKLIAGKEVLLATIHALALHNDPAFFANLPAGVPVPKQQSKPTEDDAVETLGKRLSVAPVKDSRLVTVTVDDANPERARRILSTLTHTYMDLNVDRVVNSTTEASTWLRSQVDSLKDELEKSEMALHEYKKDKRILSVSMDDQSNMLREEMSQLKTALTAASTRRAQLQSRYDEIAKVNPEHPTELPAAELLQSAVLGQLRNEYVAGQSALDQILGAGRGDNHPDAVAARARVESTRGALIAEVKNVQGALQSDVAAITNELAGLSRLYHSAEQRAFELNLMEIEYRRLERGKSNQEKLFGMVLERSKETDLAGLMRFNNIRVTEEAGLPRAPVSPSLPKNLGLGFLAALLFAAMATLGRELLDRRVRGPDEVEAELGLTLLGVLPELTGSDSSAPATRGSSRRRRAGAPNGAGTPERLAHDQPASNTAEAARGIRTNLSFMSPDKPLKRILVTSASPGDGKTMVASTIAISLAQTGKRVLLLDCDLRRSRVHRIFGKSNDFGLTNASLDPTKIDYARLETDIPNLSVLTSGPRIASPSELLQSDTMRALLDELSSHFDRIVIDSPPVNPVADAAILTGRVDTTIFVVRSNRTVRELARRGARALREVGAHVSGVVVNALPTNRKGYYYYSYYYSHGYKYGEEASG